MYGLTLGLVISSQDLYQAIQEAAREMPIQFVLEQREIGEWPAMMERLERARPDVFVLGLEDIDEPLESAIRRLKSIASSPKVILVNRSAEPDVILKSLRAGADEYVYPPLQDDLRAALQRIAEERSKVRAGTHPRGRVFGFLGAKGGCGVTTLACHVSVELRRLTELNVLLADFDIEAGIIGFLMNSKSPYSVVDAVENANRLDISFWKALVSNGTPGVEVVMAPTHTVSRKRWKVEDFRHLIPFMRGNYDWTVLDLGRSLTPLVMSVAEDLDTAFLVTTLEVPALHQTKHILQTLWDAGMSKEKIKVVLNRMPKRSEITLEELDRMLGVTIYATVPNDYPALYDAYSERSLVPHTSNLGKHFSRVAARIAGVQSKEAKGRFFSFSI